MKKVLKVLLSCVTCAALTTTFVSAGNFSVEYNGGNEKFVFNGSGDEAVADQVVTLRVSNVNPLESLDEIAETIYLRQTVTDVNGEFSLEGELGAEVAGDIWATIIVGDDASVTKHLYKSGASDIIAAVGSINSGTALSALSAKDKLVLLFDEVQDDLSDAKNTYASEVIQNEKPYDTNSIAGVRKAYDLGVLLYACDNGGMTLDVYTSAVESGKLAIPLKNGVQYNAQTVFDAYSDEVKAQIILSNVNGNEYKSNSDFFAAIYDAVIMKEFSAAGLTNNEKYAVVKANDDYLGIASVPGCEGWGELFNDFKTDVFAKPITSVETLKKAFDDVAALDKYKNDGSDDGDGDGGYSGGSLGGGMPARPIVSPELMPEQESGQSFFNDLAGYEWALESIHNLAKDGIINGKADRVFAPGDTVTRAEFVKMLVGALKIASENEGSTFADVPEGHWAYDFVRIASATNIVNGISEGYYGANEKISRQDMAVMCFRAIEYLDGEIETADVTTFADDASISDYAKGAVGTLSKMGIINGKGKNIFDPQNVATRAEAAKVIYSLLGR